VAVRSRALERPSFCVAVSQHKCFCVVVVTCLIDLVPKLMFTVLYSSCADDCDMLPECTDADRECEENQTVDSTSIFQS